MNWRYTSDPTKRYIEVYADGLVTDAELLHGALTISRDQAMGPDVRVLVDLARATEWKVTAGSLVNLALLPQFRGDARRAVVVQQGFGTGVFHFYKQNAPTGTVEVFSDRPSAVAWLNRGKPIEQVVA